MFTERFIKVPIKTYNVKEAELTGKPDYEDSWIKFNPLEIEYFKPSQDNDTAEECTYVTFKSGNGMFIYLLPAQFEELLNNYNK